MPMEFILKARMKATAMTGNAVATANTTAKSHPMGEAVDRGIRPPKKKMALDGQNARANNTPNNSAPQPPLTRSFFSFGVNCGRCSLSPQSINKPMTSNSGPMT